MRHIRQIATEVADYVNLALAISSCVSSRPVLWSVESLMSHHFWFYKHISLFIKKISLSEVGGSTDEAK